ncbi:acyltransferase family protein [Kitasatospora sp. NPDC050543]|uniref:acyltransferase family protein n=1 Tax=Kitasatospora sp. NPDC050543 TaxID=3364054 RepID=UPI0037BB92A9
MEQQLSRPSDPGARATAGPRSGSRLGWLDALRGLAAAVVALYHFNLPYLIPYGVTVGDRFDYGIYGVMLFFLVSGYIVPASLERRGDVRAFWIGRLFRIHPVLLVVVAGSLLVLPTAHRVVAGFAYEHPLLSVVANGMLLQDLTGVPNALNVMWTLSYEMVFYFFVTALFVLGLHRRSAPIAVSLAAAALLLGGVASQAALSVDPLSTRHLVLSCAVVAVMGLACVLSGNPALTRTGALLLGALGLVLAGCNGRASLFETLMIFATMFSGTVLHRAENGQLARLPAALCCGFVIAAGFLVGALYDDGPALARTFSSTWMSWSYAYVGAWVTFALGMALRRRRFPRVLGWLGAVSYSLYLLHNPVVHAMDWLLEGHPFPRTGPGKFIPTAIFVVVVLALSHLAHRLVELPAQKLGRRVLRALPSASLLPPADSPAQAVPSPVLPTPAAPAATVATEHERAPVGGR